MIATIADSEYAELQLIIEEQATPIGEKNSRSGDVWLFDALMRYASARRVDEHDAAAVVDCVPVVGSTDRIQLSAELDSGDQCGIDQTVAKIKLHQLDVLLVLSSTENIEMLRDLSKYGVWYYEHGTHGSRTGDHKSFGILEVLRGEPFLRSALLAESRGSGKKSAILYESYSSVYRSELLKSRNEHFWKILSFVPRSLKHLWANGEIAVHTKSDRSASPGEAEPSMPAKYIDNRSMFWHLLRYILRRIKRKLHRKFYVEKWILLYNFGSRKTQLSEYKKIMPPDGKFWADPHILFQDNSYYVFFEEADVQSQRGRISVFQLHQCGKHSDPIPIIEKPYHLSYPFVFEWKGEWFLIPESADNESIDAYRCVRFPDKWEYHCTLMENIVACDTTLYQHNDKWWLFCTVRGHEASSAGDELYLFHADHPLSTVWTSHDRNPVISDIRSARPAGRIFEKDGKLFRPSQNGSYRYGYGVKINEILELTTSSYSEKVVEEMQPNWDKSIKAIHSYSRMAGLTVLDAVARIRK